MLPELHTDRFLLTQIVAEDQPFIFEGLSHPQVIPYYGVRYHTLEETKAQMDFYAGLLKSGSGGWWKISDTATGEPLGAIGFNQYVKEHRRAEIGYWLLPRHWKKGIISEVLPVLIRYLQEEKKVHRVEALVEEGNDDSTQVLLKAGFTFEGRMRDYEIKNEQFISLLLYSLLPQDNPSEYLRE
jgi:[ribosomal protein S5]-alanine N-acetyltransferase